MLGYVPKLPKTEPVKPLKSAMLVVGGSVVAALTIGWVAFLIWLIAEAVIAVVHWI